MGPRRADLHVHSDCSDGTDTVPELLAAAVAAGLDTIGLTDHDTTAGWGAAQESCPPGLTVLPGVELSCVSRDRGGPPVGVHLLGYLLDPEHGAFRAERRRLRDARGQRAQEMVGRMASAGLPITWEQVRGTVADAPIGRPHMARALVAAGLAGDVTDAFARFLGHDQPWYVAKADTDVGDGVALIRAAGGVPVLAHPLARRRGRVVDDAVLARLTDAGLLGLEVDHPDHDEPDRAHLRGLAAELGLVGTGSSDYHGANKPTPIGAERSPAEVVEAIIALSSGCPPIRARRSGPEGGTG